MKTFKFYTLGCKVNQYETQLILEELLRAGLKEANSNTPADLYIVNTCTVTASADRESRRFIRHSIKENPKATIVAAGCYVEKDADIIKEIDDKIIILPNKDKGKIGTVPVFADIVTKAKTGQSPFFITHFYGHTKAFIKIQDGCDNFCSYCKVPYVRGAPKSREKQEIIHEAKSLLKNNYKELVLSGICLGAYGKDLDTTIALADILIAIVSFDGDFRIRLSSVQLQDITEDLIDVIKNHNKICNHLHIPLQSGDDEILRKMNRKYSSDEFIEKIKKIKKAIPGIAISTDVIVGFPGETDEAFKNTLKCIKKIEPMRTHIFSYNKRKGTNAFNLGPDVNKDNIKQRYTILKKLTDALARSYIERSKSRPQPILVENTRDKKTGKLCGYTDTYIKLTFPGPDEWMGKFIKIGTDANFSLLQ
ncbi:MAG: tRNA (N(6)-L-threonylcarbamoyladenosine(37)-C(2))-methylthiotransferase MtaB [Candidatus Omnitrophota bacterium]|nr:MAG: tRNA (N(6)-L-threonylcarbamoyladenosine(37)-C(2))-methylthiotransferase MtaB [Candidatus Omnitrophota bacterium]